MLSLADRLAKQYRRSRRVMLASVGLGLPLAAFSVAGAADSVLRLVYVVLGFSLIIFLHELGHFVVARACSVKCLAFSIGIGPRMLGWRKGVGLTFGADPYDPDKLKEADEKKVTEEERVEHVEAATTQSDLPQSAAPAVATENPEIGICDYRISWLPLGGYVRMLGQDDMDPTRISNDPRAFNRRPIWQRMCIVSAGVIMNVIFAAVAFSIIFSPGIGIDFPPAQFGQIVYNSPAYKAGLHMGDKVVAIDGERPPGKFVEFTDVMIAAALSSGDKPIQFEYVPYGQTGTKKVSITPVVNPASGFLAIGAESLPGMKVAGSGKEYAKAAAAAKSGAGPALGTAALKNLAELSKIRAGDEIVAVDGIDCRDDYIKLYNQVQAQNGAPVTLTLHNTKDKKLPNLDITMIPEIQPRAGVEEPPAVAGLAPVVTLGEPQSSGWIGRIFGLKSAAEAAGLKEGDVVLRVGDRTNPTEQQFLDVVKASAGKKLDIVVDRDGSTVTLQGTPQLQHGVGRLGIPIYEDLSKPTFHSVSTDGAAANLNLPPDATIVAVDGQKVENWMDIYSAFRQKGVAGKPIPVTFKTSKGEVTRQLPLSAEKLEALKTQMHYMLGITLENRTETQVANNWWGAIIMGMDHTKKFIEQVYMTLAGLFRRTVSPSNLHGIVGITKVGYDMQQRGSVWLWYVLALVSVNLAVANFLPLPIVDGGLFLLLILEKVRGKPLSLKVQSAIQVVGIVLLAGLFLYVTFNDIKLF